MVISTMMVGNYCVHTVYDIPKTEWTEEND